MKSTYNDLTYAQIAHLTKLYATDCKYENEDVKRYMTTVVLRHMTKKTYYQAKFTADRNRVVSEMPFDESSLLYHVMANYFLKD